MQTKPSRAVARKLAERQAYEQAMSVAPVHRAMLQAEEQGKTERPDWDDLRGCAPSATVELSSEDFVRRLRDSWQPLDEA